MRPPIARRLAILLFAGTLLGAMSVLPASAHGTICPSSRVCLYEDSSFDGCEWVRDSGDNNFTNNDPCDFGGDGFNDDTSSGINHENHTVTLCGDTLYLGGVSDLFTTGEHVSQVSNNDTASSLFYGLSNCRA